MWCPLSSCLPWLPIRPMTLLDGHHDGKLALVQTTRALIIRTGATFATACLDLPQGPGLSALSVSYFSSATNWLSTRWY